MFNYQRVYVASGLFRLETWNTWNLSVNLLNKKGNLTVGRRHAKKRTVESMQQMTNNPDSVEKDDAAMCRIAFSLDFWMCIYGLYMLYIWFIHGGYTVYIWRIYGKSIDMVDASVDLP